MDCVLSVQMKKKIKMEKEEEKIKESAHLSIDHKVWRAYKKFCANLEPEEHPSGRVEKFMVRDMKRKRGKNGTK